MNIARHKLSPRRLIVYGVTLLFTFALVVGWLQMQSRREMQNIREWAHHSRDIQASLNYFRTYTLVAESSQRGYLLAHDETYLASYSKAAAGCSTQFKLLRSLTADNPDQQRQLDGLEPLLNDKLQFMGQTIALEQSGNHPGAVQMMSGGGGRLYMIGITNSIDAMQAIEAQVLSKRQSEYYRNFDFNSLLSIVSLSLCLGTIILILFIVRYLEQLQTNVLLAALKEMVEFEKGNISVEEYMRRRSLAAHGPAREEAERLLGLRTD